MRLDEAGNSTKDGIEAPASLSSTKGATTTSTISLESDLAKELRSGITAYVNPDTQGFSGVFKQRYSDFLVNEILPSGDVCHLVDIEDGIKRKLAGAEKHSVVSKTENLGVAASSNEKGTSTVSTSSAIEPEIKATASEGNDAPQAQATRLREEQSVKVADNNDHTVEEKTEEIVIPSLSDEDQATLLEVFGEKSKEEILRLWRAVLKHPKRKRKDFEKVYTDVIDDKDLRTKGHQIVRRIFQSKLETTTNDNSSIVVTPALSHDNASKKQEWRERRQAGGQTSGGKLGWAELGGEYLHFTLYKENKDTMEVISFLASRMKLHSRNFAFAGTKDRRGVTVQRISAYRVQSARLAGLGRDLRNAKIGGFKYEPAPLSLGDLHGNEFNITLREAHFDGEEGLAPQERLELATRIARKASSDLKSNGFINYYGLQRFGTFATSTDEIGTKLLQDDCKGAIELILSYTPEVLAAANGEGPENSIPQDDCKRAVALETWQATKSWQKALEMMPRKFSAESNIIKHLGHIKNGKLTQENDYQGAIMTLQRNLRLMYVHAYQSLVWNAAAGHRWNVYGNNVVEGDLVIITSKELKAEDVDEAGELVINPSGNDRATNEGDFVRARPLSKEEAESGTFKIWDIVLPLPGFDVKYPANNVGKFYEEFMSSEKGGKLDPHNMRRKQKDFSLSGGYRKLLARPESLECEVKAYTSDTEQLVKTDLDILSAGSSNEPVAQSEADVAMPDVSEQKLAVILKMQLGSSQYATMALRELLKAGGLKTYKSDFTR